jgi:hypothetical protein
MHLVGFWYECFAKLAHRSESSAGAIAHHVREPSAMPAARGLFRMIGECQPTYVTRFWATSSASVFGCAGS